MATVNGWNNQIAAANSAITLNSGTNAVSISSDASATTVNVGTGGAAKTVTLGSTTTSSSLALKYGTSDFSIASATGNVMTALDTGEINYPLQPAFKSYLASSTANDKTGDGTAYTVPWDTEEFDQGGDFSANTFTAPVNGKYFFNTTIAMANIGVHTTGQIDFFVNGSQGWPVVYLNPAATKGGGNALYISGSLIISLSATDTVVTRLTLSGSTKTVGVTGGVGASFFAGYLFV